MPINKKRLDFGLLASRITPYISTLSHIAALCVFQLTEERLNRIYLRLLFDVFDLLRPLKTHNVAFEESSFFFTRFSLRFAWAAAPYYDGSLLDTTTQTAFHLDEVPNGSKQGL